MEKFYWQIGLSTVLLLLYIISRIIVNRLIVRHGKKYGLRDSRISYVRKLIRNLSTLIFLSLIAIVWELSVQGLSVYFASFFAVAGIALFAQWSVLSNITSSIILYFYFPYKIGAKVRIIDGDNSVEGEVQDITMFMIRIITDDGREVGYPNNLAIQKPMMRIK